MCEAELLHESKVLQFTLRIFSVFDYDEHIFQRLKQYCLTLIQFHYRHNIETFSFFDTSIHELVFPRTRFSGSIRDKKCFL